MLGPGIDPEADLLQRNDKEGDQDMDLPDVNDIESDDNEDDVYSMNDSVIH